MNTIQGLMEQIKLSQNQISGLNGQLPAKGISQDAPAATPAPAAPAAVMAADSQSIAFNPAQINASDLESAHKALDPDRVARLLGLLD